MKFISEKNFSSQLCAAYAALLSVTFSPAMSFADHGHGGNGGQGNCRGNGNYNHGCGSSVATPDILRGTSQTNPRQPSTPIPTANQLPPQTPPVTPPVEPRIAIEFAPLPPQRVPDAVPQIANVVSSPGLPQPGLVVVQPQSIQMVPPITPPPLPPQTLVIEPPKVPQQVPMAVPPQVPQPVPTLVPPQVPQQVPTLQPKQAPESPPLPQPRAPDPMPQVTTNVMSPGVAQPGLVIEPRPIAQQVPLRIPPETRLVVIPSKNENPTNPQVEVTAKADSAAFNQQMIANIPGRQPSDAYALFKNDSNGEYRECIVSGFERRKVIKPNGEVIYTGSLPSLRTVSAELADIPSWHPHEAGCIISVEHKKKYISK